MRRKIFYILFSLFISLGFAQKNQELSALNELRLQLDEIFEDPNFSGASWGVMIQSLENGEIIYNKNADKLFVPASAIKIFTSSAGLLLLGSDYKFRTSVYTDGRIENNKLKGNLIIRGAGDPSISGKYSKQDIFKIFREWAGLLKQKGIEEITGNIWGDDDLFDEKFFGEGWEISYRQHWFAPPLGALSFNNNLIEIVCESSDDKLPAEIFIKPELKHIILDKKVITSKSIVNNSVEVSRSSDNKVVRVKGKIASGSKIKKYLPVENPTKYFVTVLKNILEQENIKVKGYAADLDEEISKPNPDDLMLVFEHYSVQLKKIINEVNKNSNNFYAEQLLKTIGFEIFGYGTTAAGVKAAKNLFKVIGINPENLYMADGSGLSRLSLTTPKQVVKILNYLSLSNEFDSFYESLPIAGSDGTLAERMKKTSAENNARAKPGFLPGVKTLAGYINTSDNEPLAFCFFANNFLVPASLASNIQDAACIQLANFKRN